MGRPNPRGPSQWVAGPYFRNSRPSKKKATTAVRSSQVHSGVRAVASRLADRLDDVLAEPAGQRLGLVAGEVARPPGPARRRRRARRRPGPWRRPPRSGQARGAAPQTRVTSGVPAPRAPRRTRRGAGEGGRSSVERHRLRPRARAHLLPLVQGSAEPCGDALGEGQESGANGEVAPVAVHRRGVRSAPGPCLAARQRRPARRRPWWPAPRRARPGCRPRRGRSGRSECRQQPLPRAAGERREDGVAQGDLLEPRRARRRVGCVGSTAVFTTLNRRGRTAPAASFQPVRVHAVAQADEQPSAALDERRQRPGILWRWRLDVEEEDRVVGRDSPRATRPRRRASPREPGCPGPRAPPR